MDSSGEESQPINSLNNEQDRGHRIALEKCIYLHIAVKRQAQCLLTLNLDYTDSQYGEVLLCSCSLDNANRGGG